MPGPIALTNDCCKTPCEEPESIQVPGAPGAPGAPGDDGEDGLSSSVFTTAQFLMPAEGANVSVAVTNNEGIAVGGKMFVTTAGTMQVISKTGTQVVLLQNLANTASSLYTSNAAPTTAIPTGSLIMPTGAQGNAGVLSGAAGGALKNNFPNPDLSQANTKGTLIVGDGTDAQELSVGTNKTIPHADSAQALGIQWRGVDLSGGTTTISGAVPIANGGHGQTTANPAFNALAPTTTHGDLIYRNATVNTRLAAGANGEILKSNGAGTTPSYSKLVAAMVDSTYKVGLRQTTIINGETVNLNAAPGTEVVVAITPGRYLIRRVVIESASTTLAVSPASLGLYTATGLGGIAIVTAGNTELTSLTTANIYEDLTLAAPVASTVLTAIALFIYLSAAHGGSATLKLWAFGEDLTP